MARLNVSTNNYEGGGIDVDTDDGYVTLTIHEEAAGEPRVDRLLTAMEARALAAALMHFANEAAR